jgi:cell division septal protein FtsQ
MTRVRYIGTAEAGGRQKRAQRAAEEKAPVSHLVKFLIAVTLCGLGFIALMRCELSQIRVQGASLIDLGVARAQLEPQLGTALLLVDTKPLRDILRADPWVDEVSIHKRLPGEMRIVVHQAQPCLRLADGRSISGAGEILPSHPDVDLTPLPLLRLNDKELESLRASGSLSEFCAALGQAPWPFEDALTGVSVSRGNWQLLDGAGIRYELGEDHFTRRLRRLSVARERFAAREGDCVDLRFDRQIVLIPAVAGSFGG